MSEAIKQIRIRTAAVTRLRKQYQSYVDQVTKMKQKISTLPSSTQDEKTKLKKQNEFLGESQSVLYNVKQKLIESYQDLDLYVKQKSSINEVQASPQKAKAVEVLKEIETYLENIE